MVSSIHLTNDNKQDKVGKLGNSDSTQSDKPERNNRQAENKLQLAGNNTLVPDKHKLVYKPGWGRTYIQN
jgi:hypothetical protein